jgi:hypothetical protein
MQKTLARFVLSLSPSRAASLLPRASTFLFRSEIAEIKSGKANEKERRDTAELYSHRRETKWQIASPHFDPAG